MIRILSGFTGPGGSTVAFSNLVNLFNANGMKACLYGPHEWEGIKCAYNHFRKPPDSRCARMILSTHETEIFPIKAVEGLKYDAVHFVSDFQKKWQGVDGTVIPNVVTKYKSIPRHGRQSKVVGIIGSIDQNKRVPKSIQRALEEGNDTQAEYWDDEKILEAWNNLLSS